MFFSMKTQTTHGSQGKVYIHIECCKETIKTLNDLHPNGYHFLMTPQQIW